MEFTDCCKAVEAKLADWRTKFSDVSRKFDRLESPVKQTLLPNVADIHMLLSELEDRIEQLKSECPTESDEKEVEGFHTGFRAVYAEEMAYIGGAPSASVSG